jgi:LysR family nitrogen assimilation transcriptional regulator
MTLAQLAAFERIVELKSLSRAAAVLRIAQPALSRQMRALETQLGTALLVRHRWGVTPTAAGEVLLEHARRLRRDMDAAKDAVRALAAEPAGYVSLGVPASLATALLPPLAAALRMRYPKLRVNFTDGFSAALHAKAIAGDLDLAILYEDRHSGLLAAKPLLLESLMWVLPPANLGESSRDRLGLILPGRPNRLRLIVDEALAGRVGEPWLETDSLAAMIAMVAGGQGYTVLPYSAVHTQVQMGLVDIAAIDPPVGRTLLLARPLQRPPTAATTALEGEVRTLVVSLASVLHWRPLTV